MTELAGCKSKRKCMFCKKEINKGELCNSTRHGTACKSCYEKVHDSIFSTMGTMFPDNECTCPLCKGTGKVNRIIANGGSL